VFSSKALAAAGIASRRACEELIFGGRVQVNGIIPTLGTFAPITIPADNNPVTIAAPISNSKGTWIFTIKDPTIAKISGGSIIGLKVGTTTVNGVQSASGLYGQSNILSATVTVTTAAIKPTPTPSASTTPKATVTPSATPIPASKIALIKVTIAKRVVTVSSNVKSVVVTIDGKVSGLGRHTLTPGKHVYLVMQGTTIVYSKTLTIK